MKYLRIVDEQIIYPYDPENLRKDNPNTSFPDNLTQKVLDDHSVYEVRPVEIPFDISKNYSEGTPEFINEEYYQNWIIDDATPEDIEQRFNSQWSIIRKQRSEYLSDCDWTQLLDTPLTENKKQEWSIYRQELRDITTQPDPFNIVWPTKPQ